MKITKLIKTTFISLITIITFTQTTLAQKTFKVVTEL